MEVKSEPSRLFATPAQSNTKWMSFLVFREVDEASAKKLREHVAYFVPRLSQMNYATRRARGLPIGSGITEGACKPLIGDRAKRSGQRWRHRGLLVPRSASVHFDKANASTPCGRPSCKVEVRTAVLPPDPDPYVVQTRHDWHSGLRRLSGCTRSRRNRIHGEGQAFRDSLNNTDVADLRVHYGCISFPSDEGFGDGWNEVAVPAVLEKKGPTFFPQLRDETERLLASGEPQ